MPAHVLLPFGAADFAREAFNSRPSLLENTWNRRGIPFEGQIFTSSDLTNAQGVGCTAPPWIPGVKETLRFHVFCERQSAA